jgi:hypothetical protein
MIPIICDYTHNGREKARKNILFNICYSPIIALFGEEAEKCSVPIQEKKIWFLNKHIQNNTQLFYALTIKPEH